MQLLETRIERRAGEVRLVGVIRAHDAEPEELYVSVPEAQAEFLVNSADAFVPALLVPCMESREDLQVDRPVSPRLLRQTPRVQDVLLAWNPEFRRAALAARPRADAEAARAPGTIALFSGGVDSFHTLLRSVKAPGEGVPRATHLLFVKGLEQTHRVLRDVEAAIAQVAEVAAETGTQLVVADTNFRDRFSVNYVSCYCGAALASTALALTGGFGTLVVPSSYSYSHLPPCGSHPLLDPLWSTESLEVVHHGAEATRADKLAALVAEWPESLARIRVCQFNDGGPTNCGRCGKCLRTMLALDLVGALGRARLFPPKLPADAEELFAFENEVWLEELQWLARRVAPGSPTARLVDRVLARRRRRAAVRSFCRNTPLVASALEYVDRLRGTGRYRTE